jgi:glycopeptide antibiotics resistance protein
MIDRKLALQKKSTFFLGLLVIDLAVLFWLVWSPASSISVVFAELPVNGNLGSTYLDWLGNFLLLVPTGLLVKALWDHFSSKRISFCPFLLHRVSSISSTRQRS